MTVAKYVKYFFSTKQGWTVLRVNIAFFISLCLSLKSIILYNQSFVEGKIAKIRQIFFSSFLLLFLLLFKPFFRQTVDMEIIEYWENPRKNLSYFQTHLIERSNKTKKKSSSMKMHEKLAFVLEGRKYLKEKESKKLFNIKSKPRRASLIFLILPHQAHECFFSQLLFQIFINVGFFFGR